MMQKKQLRRADLITAVILMLGGIWIYSEALKMPMKESYGGVQNVWYVSPALFPLAIGGGIIILSVMLLVNAVRSIKAEGFSEWKRDFSERITATKKISESSIRFLGVVSLFVSFVFLFIPRVDFFLGSVLFLLSFITMFHFDDERIFHRLLSFYVSGCVLFLVYFGSRLHIHLEGFFKYSSDVLFLLFIIAYGVYARIQANRSSMFRKKFRIALLLALIVPLLLTPVFRYFLLVPLPKEGGIIKLMNLLYYTIF